MKRIKTVLTHILLAAFMGGTLISCTSEELEGGAGGKDEPGDGDGLISISLFGNPMTQNKTRVEPGDPTTYLNFEAEDRVQDVRVILYDMNGKAQYIQDYDATDDSQWVKNQFPTYQTKAFKVVRRKYQIAVLVNYKNPWKYYDTDRDNNATSIDYRTRNLNHSKSVLTDTPFDFAKNAGTATAEDEFNYGNTVTIDNYKSRTFIMQTLAGCGASTYAPTMEWDNAFFFMSNADGLVDVNLEDVKQTDAAAENSPIKVRVERALAKVAFLISPDITIPENVMPYFPARSPEFSDRVSGSWGLDVFNTKVYPIRKPTNIAPVPYGEGAGESMEVPTTSRRDRYALDPNYSSQNLNDFFTISTMYIDPIYSDMGLSYYYTLQNDFFESNNPHKGGYADPSNPYSLGYIEYIPENTMVGTQYNTANTSNIILVLTFTYLFYEDAPDRRSLPVTRASYSRLRTSQYVVFNEKVYPTRFVEQWLEGYTPSRVYDYLTQEPLTTAELDAAGFTDTQKQELLATLNNYEGAELYGMKFYTTGQNFYRIPIRHFSNEQSPTLNTGHGRYGVVRNNTYLLTLEAVKGLGSPTIPPPGPITEEMSKYLSVQTAVYPWVYHIQEPGLGGGDDGGGGSAS
ncbi:Mfa1 family fimbria major subunit [uncultured Alistipes sp.]|jgi:hypothetical protein|uniref:Mfa1 family fimbria major subunit n=1 Tax=uncultured Alistipes sp. TaxID=538949 RepID=UPI0025FF7212|nr:Mfa1 family fimbria major subunit [uncultured Alistipes sp.]